MSTLIEGPPDEDMTVGNVPFLIQKLSGKTKVDVWTCKVCDKNMLAFDVVVHVQQEHPGGASRPSEWQPIVNFRTNAEAWGLLLKAEDIIRMAHLIHNPAVEAGWWFVQYQDCSYRVFNPDNFSKAYCVKSPDKEDK
jgi:hypothetical protein